MKRTRAQLKTQARQALEGNYGVVIGTMLVLSVIILVFCVLLYMMIVYTNFSGGLEYSSIGMALIWYVLYWSVVSLFGIGILRVIYQICMAGTADFGDLFYAFRSHPMRFLGVFALLVLIRLLANIPGFTISVIGKIMGGNGGMLLEYGSVPVNLVMQFFVSLQYTLAPLVLIDHPDYGIMESLRTSKELMKGNRWRYVVLILSFIGVLLLGYLTLGIGLLWLFPYYQCTVLFFYLDRKEEYGPPEPAPVPETNFWS